MNRSWLQCLSAVLICVGLACSDDAPSSDQGSSNSETDGDGDPGDGDGDGDGEPGDGDGDPCEVGIEGCPCTGGGVCDPGLTCVDGICVCPIATEGCPCTGGGACDPGLICDGGICQPEMSGDGDGDPGDGDGDPSATCGDGVVEGMEECDDGNMDNTDACVAGCLDATCGDGFVQAGVEECDDGNMDDTDGCSNMCVDNSLPVSCKDILDADPNSVDDVYMIDPDGVGGDAPVEVLCDMTTDNGGWTMVASTLQTTLNDEASAYYDDLQSFNPAAGHTGVWNGMRAVINGNNSDIRFTCIVSPNQVSPTVDLSFYDIIWYDEITTGDDGASCFSQGNGQGADNPPERRDNLTNQVLMAGDPWNAEGFLEGEDGCGDADDFTVDFDDRGMDSDESDGTDWGEDDGVAKCAVAGANNGAWHIWVREL